MNSFLFVYNPVAGGHKAAVLAAVREKLQAAGKTVQSYETRAAGDAIRFLQEEDWQADVIVAAGGDGTVNEVINGLSGKQAVLAVIPQGTTNVLAEELALPKKADAIVAMLLAGKTQPAYPVQMNQRRFLLMAGVGYDARVVAGADMQLKKRIGKGAYILSMLQQIFHYGKYRYVYRVDGGLWLPAASLIISNGKYYGGSFVLSKTATVADPYLQVFAFSSESRLALLRYLLMLPLGSMEKARGIVVHRAQRVEVRAEQADVVQVDGDLAGELPVEMQVENTPLTLIIP